MRGKRPRVSLAALAAFWVVSGGALGAYGLNGPATGLIFLAAVMLLPCALYFQSSGEAGRLEPLNPERTRVPGALWAFLALVVVSVVLQRDETALQNAFVYVIFVALMALAAAWTSAGSGLLLLRWLRAAAVVMSVVYLVSVVVYGPGNYVVYPARIFGETVWIGMVAAVPLAVRNSRWAHAIPVLVLLANVMSLSRTSIAVCALLYLGLVARGRGPRDWIKIVALGVLVAAAGIFVVNHYQPLRDRFVTNDNEALAGVAVGTSGRTELWQTTWESIQSAPWLGHGIGSAGTLLADPADPGSPGHPHNDYLRLWHDFGLLGLGLWVTAIAVLAVGAHRRRRAADNEADWAIHQAALLALFGLSLNIFTSNLLVYTFAMIPVAVIVGTSLGRGKVSGPSPTRTSLHTSPGPGRPLRRRADAKGSPLDLRGYLKALKRRWLTVATLTLIGLCGGIAATAMTTPQYQATSQIFVSAHSGTNATELNQGSTFTRARVQSYAEIISSPQLAAAVGRQLDLGTPAEQLAQRIDAVVKPNTVLIGITVTDVDPVRAANVANAAASEAGRLITDLERPPGRDGAAAVHIVVSRTATTPDTPVSPRPYLNTGIGLFAGLTLGLGLAMLRHTLDTSLRSGAELADATGLALLGSVPFDKAAADDPLPVRAKAFGGRAEAFRLIRTNLRFTHVDTSPKVIVMTSALPNEGKTTTSANLALSLAEAGHRVCLVDADLRNPSVAKTFGLVQNAGLTSALIGSASTQELLQDTYEDNLLVLASGPIPPNPTEMLASERMREVLGELAAAFDMVIVDSAPVLPVADTLGLANMADGVVLVVRAGRTPLERVMAAAGALDAVGIRMLGAVLSIARALDSGNYGYGYGQTAGQADGLRGAPPSPRQVADVSADAAPGG